MTIFVLQIKVTAHNNAGFTTAVYNFTTLTPQGSKYILQNHGISNVLNYFLKFQLCTIQIIVILYLIWEKVHFMLILR